MPVVLAAQQPRDTATLEPLVVTATRVPVPLGAVSAAITVLRGDELAARGVRTVAEALREVLGVAVVRTGSYGGLTSLFVRGGESDYTKVLVDGVPVNDPGGAYDLAHLTIDAVERIELVRGPASVLYGSDAVTGVLQIVTRAGAGRARAGGEAGVGSYGTWRVLGGLAGEAGPLAYTLGASRTASDGIYPVNNDAATTVLTGRARLAGPVTSADLTGRWRDGVAHFPTDGSGQVVDANQHTTERGPTVGLTLRRHLGTVLDGEIRAAWHQTDARYDDAPDGPADTSGFYASRSTTDTRRAGVGARVDWRPSATTVVTTGVDLERQWLRQSSVAQSSFGTFTSALDTARSAGALYAQVVAGLERAWTVTAGARLEDNEWFGRRGTWRAGVAWRPVPGTRLRAAAGTGFKEPTFFEQFGGAGTVGNPRLDPERSVSWELGAERALFGARLTAAVTYFDQRFRDMVEYTFAPPPPDTVNYFNVGGARARGVEASLTTVPARGLTARLAYTYLHTAVTDSGFAPGTGTALAAGQPLLRRPAHSGAFGLTWVPAPRWQLGTEVRAVGERDDLDFSAFPFTRVTLAPYAVVAVSAAVSIGELGLPGVVLRLRADNVFDTRYGEIRGFRSPGRAVFVGVEARTHR
jgi:outer membrane cobalamin receptor